GPRNWNGTVDFRAHDGNVTVGGNIARSVAGTPSPVDSGNQHSLFMGDGLWKAGGNVTLSLRGGDADSSTLELTGTGTQVLTVSEGSLHDVRHRSSGVLRLGALLGANSLEHSGAGSLDLGGKGLRLAGNLTVTGGADGIAGLADTLIVGGDAVFKGTGGDTLPLSSQSRWHLRVKGALSADSAFIGNSDARGGVLGRATAACVDRGLNFNWSFDGGSPTQAPTVTRDPVADTSVYVGQTLALSAGVSGHAPFAWEWRRSGAAEVLSTDSIFVLDSVALADSGSYQVIVSNSTGKDTSAAARVRVQVPPLGALILRQPVDTTVKTGGNATFSLAVAGTRPIQYEWRRVGQAAPVSTDSVLVISSVADSLNGVAYYCIVSNLGGTAKDTSAEARILVRSCDSLTIHVSAESLAVDEGSRFSVVSHAVCAEGHGWRVVSGPSPRLHDPGADTLSFLLPRVTGDTTIRYLYTAYLGEMVKTRSVVVRVREAIPDPEFNLAPKAGWNGRAPLVIRPAVTNKAKLDLFPAHPLTYAWSVHPLAADSSQGGDSLSLRNPLENGQVAVELCLDNGGARRCDTTMVDV
ncbi:MAG TPA: hypothetical protein VK465_06180, partial [Fibrobacteria bacterium]|nr:hypothetical protein [Fibrobacteria bacterium]